MRDLLRLEHELKYGLKRDESTLFLVIYRVYNENDNSDNIILHKIFENELDAQQEAGNIWNVKGVVQVYIKRLV